MERILPVLRCPYTGLPLQAAGSTLLAEGQFYAIVDGIPCLVREDQLAEIDRHFQKQYDEQAAEKYDRAIDLLSVLGGCWAPTQRRRLARLLSPPKGMLLEVSVGTGSNLPYLTQTLGGTGLIVGIDLSQAMLKMAQRRAQSLSVPTYLIRADACRLPFADETFDAVFHFGGINMFGDIRQAIKEMVRVAKPGAPILIGDEGMSEKRRGTWLGRCAAKMNSLNLCRPPFAAIPWEDVEAFRLHWAWREQFYVFRFQKKRPGSQNEQHASTNVQAEVRRRIQGG
ncbi:class I SAM-dependent methyltransferase [Candidatus Darwinibacter acetoxidans]|jgi:ubiquinone/menaquinone biosynthesis C-methylase UbiE